eukprot:6183054-Pleurochrysis_carterae.AAC.1
MECRACGSAQAALGAAGRNEHEPVESDPQHCSSARLARFTSSSQPICADEKPRELLRKPAIKDGESVFPQRQSRPRAALLCCAL